MRLLGKAALGGGVLSAATVAGLAAAGVFATSATLVLTDPVAPRAEARPTALTPFDSCADLLRWYVDNNVADVGPYGWQDEVWAYRSLSTIAGSSIPMAAAADAGSTAGKGYAGSSTGTNTQEAAVDEPDFAKTDGSTVFRLVGDKRLTIVDVSATEPTVTARLPLPEHGYGSELLLLGDHVLVVQQIGGGAVFEGDLRYTPVERRSERVRVIDVDVSDLAAPTIARTDVYTGSSLSVRQYDEHTVRLVTTTGRPQLKWTYPHRGVTAREATRANRALVRATTIEDWLPHVIRGGVRSPLVDCDEVLHPKRFSGSSTVAVTTFQVGGESAPASTALTADGQVVYSSGDRLYVASTDWAWRDSPFADRSHEDVTTWLHSFDVSGAGSTYTASGTIPGSLRDRWSLDEHDGRLRVAWTTTSKRGRTNNGVSVLAEKGGELVTSGRVDDLGIGEDIQSVRWFDDLAVLVTFRQVDPLYALDLSDPDEPRMVGKLKIPGYSGYLHPIGDDLLLGLGMDGDDDGLNGRAQAAVFDISDLRDPVRISKVTFGRDSDLPALSDPRGFTWDPGTRTGLLASYSYDDRNWSARSTLQALRVSPAGQLRLEPLLDLNDDWQARTLVLPGDRAVVLDAYRARITRLR